eukprot:2176364-Rhodomonas_salina.4
MSAPDVARRLHSGRVQIDVEIEGKGSTSRNRGGYEHLQPLEGAQSSGSRSNNGPPLVIVA